jgi:hypothetical protein
VCGSGHNVLHEGVWDLFKMSLVTRRQDTPQAFLMSGAESSVWSSSPFSVLFDDGVHDSEALCVKELADRHHTHAWDDLLAGGYDRYPEAIPVRIRTAIVGRVAIGAWELRAVRVAPDGDEMVAMNEGWPGGRRPVNAKHPPSSSEV